MNARRFEFLAIWAYFVQWSASDAAYWDVCVDANEVNPPSQLPVNDVPCFIEQGDLIIAGLYSIHAKNESAQVSFIAR